ncbi:MAG: hypothetical protein UZ07_CHB004000691, partial [Chlorobi bacterium OLB7]
MEAFPAEQLIVPGVCIDVRQAVLHDSDFELTVDWIQQWEKANGSIPERSAVLLCTGW